MSFNRFSVPGYLASVDMDIVKESFRWTNKKEKAAFMKDSSTRRFDAPSIVANAIIDVDLNTIENIFRLLNSLRCKHVVLRILNSIDRIQLERIVNLINKFNVHEVTLLFNFCDFLYSDSLIEVLTKTNRIKCLVIYNSPFNKNLENIIFYYTSEMHFNFHKSKDEFFCNRSLVAESKYHHTYFNKKIFISRNGEISNSPESEHSIGNIQDFNNDVIQSKIKSPEFQKYWYIHKEITDVCKDCEFRHMCVDNRLPYERDKNQWYHKQECNYNPYIAKWKNEEGYRTLEECGVISNEKGFSIDHDKIAAINEELWGEE